MVLLFLLAPLLSSPVAVLGGSPSPNSILHAFLGLTGSRLDSTVFLSWPSFSSLTSPLSALNPSSLVFETSVFGLFFNSRHAQPLSPLPSLRVAVFLVLPLICNLWMYPVLLSLSGPSACLRGSCSLGLRGVTPG